MADLLDQPGVRNGRGKRQTASAPAAGRKGAVKRPRAAVRGQPNGGEAAYVGSPCINSSFALDVQHVAKTTVACGLRDDAFVKMAGY